ncbi:PQQ-binding-like beta-propeller repeat protein [Streptomyces sp. TLI_146]|uniref:outer membrane protein assembly factor BamB family protein n=1 Tax=Streptomyces sp. TLI_146 TaxID=1938858 RepID=UPI000C70C99B|nr:PQQ-binding-like beta-propeller repeat protein [Streptomyces sp. TLI_146]PKV82947.1 putative pyrroloquinoline-quinone binding quinoprotein [Streptomyces sp. TLI_146]
MRQLAMMAKAVAVAAVMVLSSALAPSGAAVSSSPGCSGPMAPGGDWPMYGKDYANTRTQQAERGLPPAKAATLAPRWVYDTGNPSQVVGYEDLAGTPAVARGCVYVGDAAGDVAAVNADTGRRVWRTHIDLTIAETGARAGVVVSTIAVDGQRAFVAVNKSGGPYVLALDAQTGEQVWQSPPLDSQPGAYTHASPIVYRGAVVVGFSGPEGVPTAQGGFTVLRESDGQLLKHTYTIPAADQLAGDAGGGIWSTPAVDTATGYAYVGTGNPFSKQHENERSNAILKIDLMQRRPTFGTIIASYKGLIDQYVPIVRDLARPTCMLLPENPTIPPFPPFLPPFEEARDSVGCLQQDLDFGAAPNLMRGPDGTLLVGELQKSGVYHVVRADSMAAERRILLGVSCLVCNGASTAYDPVARRVYADVSPGTLMVAFPPDASTATWLSPVGDGIHYQPVAAADGVVYTVDSIGFLDAYDARTGLQILRRPLAVDGAIDAVAALASNGVSVANHTVYVAAGSRIIAYRPLGLP